MSVGLLGGTFNPPHVGHLVMAREALEQLALDAVWLVPVAVPPHKEAEGDPGPAARLALCELAAAGEPGLAVSAVEVERGGPSYTADTLRVLHERHPEHHWTFIVGADNALGLPGWREPETVLGLARLAVAERDGVARERVAERLAPLYGGDRVAFFDMPRLDVSSSDIRRRVAAGRSIRHLVPAAVADAIAAQGFYRTQTGRLTA